MVKNPALEAMGDFKADELSIAAIAREIPTAQKIVDRAGWR
jgi:iron(III) transport system substrate-binding protein